MKRDTVAVVFVSREFLQNGDNALRVHIFFLSFFFDTLISIDNQENLFRTVRSGACRGFMNFTKSKRDVPSHIVFNYALRNRRDSAV